jgi:hypothetical protein
MLTGHRLSNHWKWVVMLVILVVGIAGIWVGACIWRRRYLKKKDRMYELGKHSGSGSAAATHSSWGPGAGSAAHVPYGDGVRSAPPRPAQAVSGPGVFMPAAHRAAAPAPAIYDEKPKKTKEKKKWVVKERT